MSDGPPDPAAEARPFRTLKGRSVVAAVESLGGASASIYERGAEEDPAPVTVRRAGEEAASADSRYEVLGEIARGGIGIVYRGRDLDLNRDVAIKVLRAEYVESEDVLQRFVEEAQVGGQLQHPGIVPVYGLGLLADGRPSFAMKLIKGKTLSELLDSNPRGIDLVAVFEQITQTMAYAHSRHVIHRDLKPANVMVGAFGEVQVVDWGFGKILGQTETVRAPDRSMIATVRSSSQGSHSQIGSVMGTPAYMPPEQAMGSIVDLDERCDVFSLGAILCEILTGKAPYAGAPADQLIAAVRCALQPALERLDAADAPAGLKQIVRDCMQPVKSDRPANARVLAERLSAYMAGVIERARQAELDALAAETLERRESQRRRRTLVLAGAVLLAILLAGGSYFRWTRDRDERHARAAPLIARALREATRHEATEDWRAARAAAHRAADIAASEGVDDAGAGAMLARFEEKGAEAEAAARARREDEELLAELVAIRNLAPGSTPALGTAAGGTGGHRKPLGEPGDRYKAMDAAYLAAFERRFGSVTAGLDRLKSSRRASDLAANIGYWCQLRKTAEALKGSDWRSLDLLARQVDPGNEDIRDALLSEDIDALRAAVEKRGDMLPLALVSQVAETLVAAGHAEEAITFLLPWNRRHPEETMIHIRIAEAARGVALASGEPERLDVALRHATAAVALQPAAEFAWLTLGLCLASAREYEEAAVAYRRVVELTPGFLAAHEQLADMWTQAGQPAQALAAVDEALASHPSDLGMLLRKASLEADSFRRYDTAISTYLRVVALAPDLWAAYGRLAVVQARKGDPDAARATLTMAVSRGGDSSSAQAEVARAFLDLGDLDAAVEHGRRAVELDPGRYEAHLDLGEALERKGLSAAALSSYQKAVALSPHRLAPYLRITDLHLASGEIPAALECARQAVDAIPRSAEAQANLAWALLGSGDASAGSEAAERGIDIDPTVGRNRVCLGRAILMGGGDLDEALAECRKGVELAPGLPDAHRTLALVLAIRGEGAAAVEAYRRGEALDERGPAAALRNRMGIAGLYEIMKDWRAALAEYEKAASLDPNSGTAHGNVGTLRLRLKDYDGAVEAFSRLVELAPTDVLARELLGYAHWQSGNAARAEADLAEALALGAADSFALSLYGEVLLRKGRPEQAVECLRRAVDSDAPAFCRGCCRVHEAEKHIQEYLLLGEACAQTGRVDEAILAYQESLNLDPGSQPAFVGLALAHAARGERELAAAILGGAAQRAPGEPDLHGLLGAALVQVGEFEQALPLLVRAAEANPERARDLADGRRLAELLPRLPAVVEGRDVPKGASDLLAFARLARLQEQFGDSTRLFAEALRADSSIAADPRGRILLEAACAAAQAGEAEQALALRWLRADLDACEKLFAADRPFLARTVPCLRAHVDLASVRDVEGLSADWAQYWRDVDALVRRVRESE